MDTAYPTHVYWGDTHLHTNLSVDANISGNKMLGPDEAYRFAKGEAVTAHNGMKARLHRPLDFLVVADHAFILGVMASLREADPALLATETGKLLYTQFQKVQADPDKAKRGAATSEFANNLYREKTSVEKPYQQSIWQRVTAYADRHNEPEKFTAFIGYEWSPVGYQITHSDPPSIIGNLHRVVFFKDSAEKTNQIVPCSFKDSSNPEDLWQAMQDYQDKTGGEVFAIPHNGNTSRGEVFAPFDAEGRPLSEAYAKTRSRWEPLYEVTQIKGDSEAHPILSPTDEFADYETWNSWFGRTYKGVKTEGWIDRKKSEYARSALKLGLEQQHQLGSNLFKFGMIGSTDSHTSLATADENNYWGKMSDFEPNSNRVLKRIWFDVANWEMAASGYTAIWAQNNTREVLFAAMKRKEVYATTGPRIEVRFFAGWDYVAEDALRLDLAMIGYNKGVPMGADLTHPPKGQSPHFLIRAVKDPDGANLDRLQVIKGWRSNDGKLHEKIYNVALSDGRQEDSNGKVPPVGSTVDTKSASYTNSIGDPELAIVWEDPDFNKDELAFYYLRVLEIPTPRWTAYDAKFFSIKNIPDDVPMVTQERAYSSPIWFTP